MKSIEGTEAAAAIDVFPEWARKQLRDFVVKLAQSYKDSGVPTVPLLEMRRAYYEANPDQKPPPELEAQFRGATVIQLSERRRTAG